MIVPDYFMAAPRHLNLAYLKINAQRANAFYYTAFVLYTAASWINLTVFRFSGWSTGAIVESSIQLVILGLLCAALIFRPSLQSRQIISICLILAGFVIWRVSKEGWLFWTCLFIVCAPEFDQHKLSKIVICVVLITIAVSTLPIVLGFAQMNEMVRSDTGTPRNALGFLHPNNLGLAFSVLAIAFCVWRFESLKAVYVLLYVAMAAFVYLVPASKTAAVSIIATLAVWLTVSMMEKKKWRKYAIYVMAGISLAAMLFSLLVMIVYDNSGIFTVLMNKLLSGRPYYSHQYYAASGIRFLGNSFSDGPVLMADGVKTSFLVDNAFDHVLLRYGLLSFILLFGAIAVVYGKALVARIDLSLVCGLTLFMLMGVTEAFVCRVECNYLLISLAFVFGTNSSRLLKSGYMSTCPAHLSSYR